MVNTVMLHWLMYSDRVSAVRGECCMLGRSADAGLTVNEIFKLKTLMSVCLRNRLWVRIGSVFLKFCICHWENITSQENNHTRDVFHLIHFTVGTS